MGHCSSNTRGSRRTYLVIFLVLGLFCQRSKVMAQCRNSDFPGKDGIAAAPARPTESSAPDPIQTGVVEFETGLAHNWVNGGGAQNTLSMLTKFGAWCNVELRWSTNPFFDDTTTPTPHAGLGDSFFAAQYRFHRESSRLPSMAVGYTVKVPTAKASLGLGSGETDHMAMLLLGKNVKRVNVLTNFNYYAIGQGHGRYDTKAEVTLEASLLVKGRWGAIGEVFYNSRLNASNVAYRSSTWAVTYAFSPRLIIDAGTNVGLSRGPGAPGKTAFVGCSYAVGDLYSQRRIPHLRRG